MSKAYDLHVRVNVDLPEWHRRLQQREAARALAACSRCGAPAVDRDIVTVDGRVDFAASFARFECGNFYAGGDGGELGALACSLNNLGEVLLDAATRLLTPIVAALSRAAHRFRRRQHPEATPAGPRIIHGPATFYIGPVGSDPDHLATWQEIGRTTEGIELR